jgi:hypothetical protein
LETERQTDGTDKAFCLPRRFAVGHGGETDMFLDHSSTEPLQWGLVWSHKHRGRQRKAKMRDRARTRREMLGRSPHGLFPNEAEEDAMGFGFCFSTASTLCATLSLQNGNVAGGNFRVCLKGI